jgi:REP element-mobilizing transposase RayT
MSQATLDELEVTAPSRRARPETPVARPAPGELDVTRPGPTTEAARKVTLEPITAGLYHLTYACLLVPRFSSHYLTGDLADHLSEWLPNICVAFGWRLEYLAVRPEYLQWVVNVQPNTSPGYLMRVMRQQTSEKIFVDFNRLKKENPSGDFWAPGYLIMGGTQPHPPQLVRDYIRQTRQRQGQEAPRPRN